ncbi:RecA-family ATPase [Gemmobacter megaterium]|uniref:RecA-family ATPase n=1 Tax=Gemmobacter megaterium TaxID=1086013 RepID=A0A1N7L0F8_9RHOB|nr:AAA family ATPase [Gemmobacter megaterium]GGE04854.1 hypothetical protein GCM10011345_07930 [Gemmobacter megaterium]SIS67246.1 RecA-family ATPase [Gemmobacter megaterium]
MSDKDPFDDLIPVPPNVTDLAEFRNRPRDARAQPPASPGGRKSRFRSAAELDGKPIPPRCWLVPDLIPQHVVTALYGDGGTGKSLLAKQLAVAVVTGGKWLGRDVTSGPVVFLSAEDDDDELHRRFAAILDAEGRTFADLDRLTFRSLAGEDALLATLNPRSGVLRRSALYSELDAVIAEQHPALLVLDTLADLFPGNENDRAHVTQFVGILIGLAIRHDCAVLLLAHPSRSGLASGSGDGGSTAWNSKVRSRLFLHRVFQGEEEPDPDFRVLSTMKANFGRKGTEIALRWRDGVFVADEAETGLDRSAQRSKAMRKFLELLRIYTEQGRDVNSRAGRYFAPTIFAAHPEAEGITKPAFADAMERLFTQGMIRDVEVDRHRKKTTVIQEAK